jgi:hypothetical protein
VWAAEMENLTICRSPATFSIDFTDTHVGASEIWLMRLVTIVLCLITSQVIAADWQYVATNGTERVGNEISYDKASVVIDGDTKKVWLKFHAVGMTNPQIADSKQLWSIRCHERQYRILVLLDRKGNDLGQYLNHTYADIQPDSWMEGLLTNVCTQKS